MRILFLNLIILLLFHHTLQQSTYNLFKTIITPSLTTPKVALADDYSTVTFYNSTSNSSYELLGSTWTVNKNMTVFVNPPYYVQAFTDLHGNKCMIYGTVKGEIRLLTLLGNSTKTDVLIDKLNSGDYQVARITIAQDKLNFAVYWRDDKWVYYGQIKENTPLKNVSMGRYITSIRYRPNSNQIVISVDQNSTNSSSITLFDTQKLSMTSIDALSNFSIMDMDFSSDGQLMYFIIKDPFNSNQSVRTYSFTIKKISQWKGIKTDRQIREIRLRGKYLVTQTYIWHAVKQTFYGGYLNNISGIGVTPDGSQMVQLIYNPQSHLSELKINRLCVASQFYSQQSDSCLICSVTCPICFQSSKKCSSCLLQFYLDYQSFTCKPCLTYCKICHDGVSCDSCFNFYYFDGVTCVRCDGVLKGCLNCVSAQRCTLCDNTNKWELNGTNGKCQCSGGYYEVNGVCSACSMGCWTCQNATSCLKCDTSHHWTPSANNSCICQSSYLLTNATCKACSSFLPNCISCTNTSECLTCQDGSTLNTETHQCQGGGSNKIVIIIIAVIIVVVIVAAVLGFIKRRRMQKKRQYDEGPLMRDEPSNPYEVEYQQNANNGSSLITDRFRGQETTGQYQ